MVAQISELRWEVDEEVRGLAEAHEVRKEMERALYGAMVEAKALRDAAGVCMSGRVRGLLLGLARMSEAGLSELQEDLDEFEAWMLERLE